MPLYKTWTLWSENKINEAESKLLRRKAEELTVPFSDQDKKDISTLIDAFCSRDDAAGLAAPQIGISKQIVVFRSKNLDERTPLARGSNDYDVLINPRITQIRGDQEKASEGCLSCPDITVDVLRSTAIKVKALDQEGRKINKRYAGFLARVAQHELDHLEGKLIIDRGTTIYYPKDKKDFFEKIFTD
ncbi:MAG: peptide deformylase [Syntrophales bacterium]|nr:peptide deformylase [Syntrophales bacterium]MDY0043318.1 peptide deformylase [Syntrophales bacterium]